MEPQQKIVLTGLSFNAEEVINVYKKGFTINNSYFRFSHINGITFSVMFGECDLCIISNITFACRTLIIARVKSNPTESDQKLYVCDVKQIENAYFVLREAWMNYIKRN